MLSYYSLSISVFLVATCVMASPLTGTAPTKYGLDVSIPVNVSIAQCFKDAGISYLIPRGYRSIGAVDTNVCDTLVNAQQVGISVLDTYFFPCKTFQTTSSTTVLILWLIS